ncbi:MAG: type II secretion system minor pseudopilin GspJ [Aequoribacter sp.]|uniref:type II secretion system minor pseudopilin GspJ n=1 Tax=Aequoribacter sp. TaxID=2847771 RepID=UPI003C407CF3
MKCSREQQGFTLIEVLIAMALTVVVASIAYSGLSAVLDSLDQTRQAMSRTSELSKALRMISRDVNQSVNRSIRDELGFTEPAMIGGDSYRGMLGLTRSGWMSMGSTPRSHLERVYYYLDDNTLYRMRSTVLDRSYRLDPDNPTVPGDGAVAMLEGVTRFDVVFLSPELISSLPSRPSDGTLDTSRWLRDWGVEGTPNQELPVALEIRLTIDGLGDMERVYVLPQS